MRSLSRPGRFLPVLLLAACARRAPPPPGEPAPEPERHGGALAWVTVQNGTPHHLRIAFRAAVGALPEVVVGTVGRDSTVALAPIPAGEPIVLAAIAEDSSRLTLPARSFRLDERWTWAIAAGAVFTPPVP